MGGGYVKLFGADLDPTDMHGESPYTIMFGPDICGPGTKKVHVIFNYKGENKLIKEDIRCKDDVLSHLYTLIVEPDNTYEVRINNEKVKDGSLEEHWDFLAPKEIKDPEAKKPEDWEDKAMIDDPEDSKPEDWDEEMDGEWEPPMVDNPDFKGEWTPKQIDNPKYKGPWVHPMIANPDYAPDDEIYAFPSISHLGLDLWQVKSGSIFDNFLITDEVEVAEKEAKEFLAKKPAEEKMKEEQEKEEKEKADAEAKLKEDDEDKYDEPSEESEDDIDLPEEGETPETPGHEEL